MLNYQNRIKISLIIATILAVSLIFLIFFSGVKEKTVDRKKGKGLLVNINNKQNHLVSLEGKMEFYWKHLYSPEKFRKKEITQDVNYLNFPQTWNNKKIKHNNLSGRGYATYRTLLYFDTTGTMALKLKDYCNSYKLWINGELVSQAGLTGRSKSETVPEKINKTAHFQALQGANELIIQTANYHEKYGGFRTPVLIGTPQKIKEKVSNQLVLDSFVLGLLCLTFLYHIGLYMFSSDKKVYLFFSLLVFFIFVRQFFLSDISLIENWLNQHVYLYLKITIASAVLSSLMLIAMFQSVFPELMNKKILHAYSVLSGLFCLYVLIAPMYYVSKGTHIFQIVVLSALIYVFYLIIKTLFIQKNERQLIAVGLLFFIFSVGIEALIFNRQIYSDYILHYGLVLFILFETYAFWVDFSETNRQNIKLNKKLESHNKNLHKLVEKKIKEATEAKERELFSVLVQKASTEKLLLNLNEAMGKLSCQNNNDLEMIEEMKYTIQQSIKDEEIEQHLLHFRKIHPYFLENLKKIHPALTNNELKLCAYLKLNLSHKDIADILHIQPESVRKAKTRMRHKMGLNSDQEIVKYLYRLDNY